MKRNYLHAILLSTLILSGALSGSLAAQQTEPSYYSKTYGASSGGRHQGIMAQVSGLLIELVGADAGTPALRVFGGMPQSGAVIVIGGAKDQVKENGAMRLVDPVLLRIPGTFDPWGCFQVPLATLPESLRAKKLFAQGVHRTILGFEYSNGLEFGDPAAATKTPAQLSLAQRNQVWTDFRRQELTESLRAALNSANDSINLRFEFSVSSNLGIPGFTLGVKKTLEAKVQRTANDTYEVSIDRESELGAGAKLPGTQVKVTGASGLARRIIYRFYSADGVAHGLIGIALHQLVGSVKLPSIDRTMLMNAEARYAADRRRLLSAQATVRSLTSGLRADWNRYVHERRWWVRPALLARYYVRRAALHIANSALSVALDVQAKAKTLLDAAKKRFARIFAGVTHIRNCIWKATQVFTFATRHLHASELRFTSTASMNLSIGALSLPNVGFGLSADLSRGVTILRKFANGSRPEQVKVTVRQETKLAARGSIAQLGVKGGFDFVSNLLGRNQLFVDICSSGGKAQLVRYTEFEAAFDIRHLPLRIERSEDATVKFGVDVAVTHLKGVGIATTSGLGAGASLTLSVDKLLEALKNGKGKTLLQRVALLTTVEGTIKAQSRCRNGFVAGIEVAVDVIDLGINVSAGWTDQGEAWKKVVKIGDGSLRSLIFGKTTP